MGEQAFGLRPDSDRRLAEALLYVARRLAETGDPHRGRVKVSTVLWRADFESFLRLRQPVTGAVHERLPEGPVPVALNHLWRHLEISGAAHTDDIAESPTSSAEVLIADRDPDTSLFTEDELDALEQAVEFFHGKSSEQCSELSRQMSSGWQALQDGEIIPYSTAPVSPGPIDFPPGTTERVARLIRAHEAAMEQGAVAE